MYFLVKKVFNENHHFNARNTILNKKHILEEKKNFDSNGKEQIVYKISHNDFVKLKNIIDIILSEKLIIFLKKKFKKIFLVNLFFTTVNGFSVIKHRDGMGYEREWKQKSYIDGQKIFKVIHYFNDENYRILNVSKLSSKPFNFFKNPRLSFLINNFYNYKFKQNYFMKDSGYEIGDALILDNNTWHGTSPNIKPNKKNINNNKDIKKIFVSYDVVVDDKNLAEKYAKHQSDRYKLNTSYKTEFDFFDDERLKLFDDIIDL